MAFTLTEMLVVATFKATKLFPANQPPAGPPPAKTGKDIFDLPTLDKIAGYTGVVNGPTYKYTIGRSDLTVMAMGAEMTAAGKPVKNQFCILRLPEIH